MLKSLLVALIVAVGMAHASDVLVYTDANFDSKIRHHDIALVEFYAPWCGHCKSLAPHYEKAATALTRVSPPVPLIKVDCTVETKTCGKYGVSGYPTLKIFKNGEVSSDYNGPREADGIVKYMKSKSGPASRELLTAADVEKFLAAEEHSVVGFFTKANSALANDFKKVADALSETHRFAHITNADLLAKYKHSDEIVIYQPPQLQVKLLPTENVYSGNAAVSDIKQFIYNQLHGLVGHRTTANKDAFPAPQVIVLYNVDFVKDTKGTNYVRNRVIKVAQKLKAEGIALTFAISNAREFRNELTEFGISSPSDSKKYIIARGSNNQKYAFDGEYSVEALEKFARDLVADKLTPFMKSEPVPTDNTDAVRTVVAKNFDEVVNDDSKDVLIEFYAPWCGHCKTLAPKYEELAKLLKDEEDIVIAKMDATANDIPPTFQVEGFPTLFFVPKNSKNSPRKYEGGREVKDFVKWLAKESTDPMRGYDRKGNKLTSSKSDL